MMPFTHGQAALQCHFRRTRFLKHLICHNPPFANAGARLEPHVLKPVFARFRLTFRNDLTVLFHGHAPAGSAHAPCAQCKEFCVR